MINTSSSNANLEFAAFDIITRQHRGIQQWLLLAVSAPAEEVVINGW
jgi:hypothetical protein